MPKLKIDRATIEEWADQYGLSEREALGKFLMRHVPGEDSGHQFERMSLKRQVDAINLAEQIGNLQVSGTGPFTGLKQTRVQENRAPAPPPPSD